MSDTKTSIVIDENDNAATDTEGAAEEAGKDGRKRARGCCVVNTSLLPLKVFNFFFFAAMGSVIPFITVYLQHLSMTASETGVITGVSVLVAFLLRPVLGGVLADWFQSQRAVLALCCLLFGAAFCTMGSLPKRTLQSRQIHQSLRCRPVPALGNNSHPCTTPSGMFHSPAADGTGAVLCFVRSHNNTDKKNSETLVPYSAVFKRNPHAARKPVRRHETGNTSFLVKVRFADNCSHSGDPRLSYRTINSPRPKPLLYSNGLDDEVGQAEKKGDNSELMITLTIKTSEDGGVVLLFRSNTGRLQELLLRGGDCSTAFPLEPPSGWEANLTCSVNGLRIEPFTSGGLGPVGEEGRDREQQRLSSESYAISDGDETEVVEAEVNLNVTPNDQKEGLGFREGFNLSSYAGVSPRDAERPQKRSAADKEAALEAIRNATLGKAATPKLQTVDSRSTWPHSQTTEREVSQLTDDANPHCHLSCRFNNGNNDDNDVIYPAGPAFTCDLIFCLSLLLYLVGRAFYASANSLTDTVTYTMLGANRYRWGRQRLFGTLGTAMVAAFIIAVNDRVDRGGFSVLFITCGCLTLLACASTVFLKASPTTTTTLNTSAASNSPNTEEDTRRSPAPVPALRRYKEIAANLRVLLGKAAVKFFMAKILVLGIFCGSAQSFIFWFLRELGCGQTVLGVCLLVNCVSSVVILRFASNIIRRLGEAGIVWLVLPAYAARFLLLSFLENPWLAIPVEVLHGVTYSLLWAAVSASTQLLVRASTRATCQAIAGAIYWDFGRGLGNLLTGQLFRAIGARWTFRVYSGLALLALSVCVVLDNRWPLGQVDTGAGDTETVVSGKKYTKAKDDPVSGDGVESQPLQKVPQSAR